MERVCAGGCRMRGLSGIPGPHPPEASHVPRVTVTITSARTDFQYK